MPHEKNLGAYENSGELVQLRIHATYGATPTHIFVVFCGASSKLTACETLIHNEGGESSELIWVLLSDRAKEVKKE